MGRTTIYLTDGGTRFPHGLHLVLTLFSCGCWFPVWLGFYLQHKLSGGRG